MIIVFEAFFLWGVIVGPRPHGKHYFGAGSKNIHWGEVADIGAEMANNVVGKK